MTAETHGNRAPFGACRVVARVRTAAAWGVWMVAWCLCPGRPDAWWSGGLSAAEQPERAAAAEDGDVDPPAAAGEEEETEGGIGFPTDRNRERQLDRGRRLLAEERWSDAATLFDEILAADNDAFARQSPQQRTWRSIKAEAGRLLGAMDKPGREAYELQFRARAERLLDQAIAANDGAGVVAVARRWLHTPAGARATCIAALEALEANQPLAAAAWLDRLAAIDAAKSFEPSLSVMRAIAWLRSGNPQEAIEILDRARAAGPATARLGGRDVAMSFPPGGGLEWLVKIVGDPRGGGGGHRGDWVMHRGEPGRNGVVSASAPLLAPRYRVPLARHPEEARALETRRRQRADQDQPVFPAGTPLAVDGTIILHMPLGLLAVDFETGKRVWLRTAGASSAASAVGRPSGLGETDDAEDGGSFSGVFEDATSGSLSSDGKLVFVVESRPAVRAIRGAVNRAGGREPAGNTLSAYEIANRGGVKWRLTVAGRTAIGANDDAEEQPGQRGWYLGPPLPLGDQLLVLAEEKGEVRLDVLAAADGKLQWSQPLAEVDEEHAVENPEGILRRLAGLSPALAEGVLVCPTGAGAAVAVDLATRTLLWAHEYPQTKQAGVVMIANGIRVQRGNAIGRFNPDDASRERRSGRWIDATPVLAGGRVLLTPPESEELLCLDLRQGGLVWRLPRKDRLYVAGVVGGRAIVVGRRAVESLDMATGRVLWQRAFTGEHGAPSGRGIVTADRLLLPLDTPEVLELDLADGRIVGRALPRGNAIPGNLLAYRGEVISQAADSLDVFHQTRAVESRIETALADEPRDPWALYWRGQVDLDRGAVKRGIEGVLAAHAIDPARVSSQSVARTLLFALRRDFAQAAPLWQQAVALSGTAAEAIEALRATVDGFLGLGDPAQAWQAMERLLARAGDADAEPAGEPGPAVARLVADGHDARLLVTPDRWIAGRLSEIIRRADATLRAEIDAFVAGAAGDVAASPAPARVAGLRSFLERFRGHPRSMEARRLFAATLKERIEAEGPGDAQRNLVIDHDLVLLELSHDGDPADRAEASAAVAALRGDAAAGGPAAAGEAWPLGRIVPRRASGVRVTVRAGQPADGGEARFFRSRLMHVPVRDGKESFVPGLDLAVDLNQPTGFIATDGYGRPIGDPLDTKSRPEGVRLIPTVQSAAEEASVVGRVVVIRSGASICGFELAAEFGGRPAAAKNRLLWSVRDQSAGAADAGGGLGIGFAFTVGAGLASRNGSIPLGARISEPRSSEAAGARNQLTAQARCTGVPLLVDGTLKLLDLRTGRAIWERQRLPEAGELFGDEAFLCVCPVDGRGAVVVAMSDGRIVRTLDLPPAERRLQTNGRRLLRVQPHAAGSEGRAAAGRVDLDLLDPVDGTQVPLGDFSGEARTVTANDGRLAVLEPSGDLTMLDLEAGTVVFRTRLNDMPPGLETVHVHAWADRYIVLAGRSETAEEERSADRLGSISPLAATPGGVMSQLVTGSLWAVERTNGEMLWPVPATILRHSLAPHAAAGLPVLLFARSIQSPREPDRPRLSLLCLDKRTGQAVYVDDRFSGRSSVRSDMMAMGCSISGDPATHTIALAQSRRDMPDLQLEFTGGSAAPRPPFQATATRAATGDVLGGIELWIKRALSLPNP